MMKARCVLTSGDYQPFVDRANPDCESVRADQGVKGGLEHIAHLIDAWRLAVLDIDLDHIEAPGELTRAQTPQPVVGAALDETLLVLVHRIQRADLAVRVAGLDFNKQQQALVAGDDVHFASAAATARVAEIAGQDLAVVGAQPGGSDAFAVVSQPLAVARLAVRPGQTARGVEPRAQTSDDGGNKGRESEALQDGTLCHIPGVWQSRIVGIAHRFGATDGRG